MIVKRADPWIAKPQNIREAAAIDFGDSCYYERRIWMRVRGKRMMPLFVDVNTGALRHFRPDIAVEKVNAEVEVK
jgi:hypothetical protein